MGSNHLPEPIFRTDPVVGVSALLWPRATCRIAAADQTHEVWRDTSAQKDTTHGPGLPCRNQRSLIELLARTSREIVRGTFTHSKKVAKSFCFRTTTGMRAVED